MKSKTIHKLEHVLNNLFDCLIIFVLLLLLLSNISNNVFHRPILAVVKGISMYPLLEEGDIVFIDPMYFSSINVGDVIVFLNDENQFVVHRVVAIIRCNGTELYVTKGDNKPTLDPYDIVSRTSIRCPDRSEAVVEGVYKGTNLMEVLKLCRGITLDRIVGKVVEIWNMPIKIVGLWIS